MIGRLSDSPSVTAEEVSNKSSDVKTETQPIKPTASEKINEAKTDYLSITVGGKGKYIFDSNKLRTNLKAAMKFEQTVDCFKRCRKNQNKWWINPSIRKVFLKSP